MKKLKRGYLNRDESNTIMCIMAVMQQLEGLRSISGRPSEIPMWEDWTKRGMMTPEAKKCLKMGHTYIKKFIDEMLQSLDKEEVQKISKKLEKFDYRLIDDYTLQKVHRDINDHFKYAVMDRENFNNIIEDMAQVTCVGCTKDYRKCALHKVYEDILLPGLGEQPNCPYACNLSEFTPEQQKRHQEILNNLKSKNKFFKG